MEVNKHYSSIATKTITRFYQKKILHYKEYFIFCKTSLSQVINNKLYKLLLSCFFCSKSVFA
ncbi:hypothetical protein CQA53_00535 [Helicobacter didelphidarum]|uniref:Uncharacterized protein n=1 Tax=Helicobacter didelphidarum TaxID=2040648 RepID=A0A3D8IRD8_9HELI|nr:hypothetical protein CQA53_00535 [Helicobacter didelphidarum]